MLTYRAPADWYRQQGLTDNWGLAWDSPFSIGLDLGQSTDFSALAVIEHVNVLPPGFSRQMFTETANRLYPDGRSTMPPARRELHVRHLQRWPLGTPYHEIVEDVSALTRHETLYGARFYFDRGGVGRAVGDMLQHGWQAGQLNSMQPFGVTTTSGDKSHAGSVTKRDLMAALQLPIQQGRFRIPARLALGEVLERELTSMTMRLSASGRDTYEVKRREGEGHGDLVIAAALAARRPDSGIRPTPQFSDVKTASAK